MADSLGYAQNVFNQFGGDLMNKAKSIAPARQALEGRQYGQEQDYLTRFRQGIAQQEAMPHMMTRLGNELGLPQAQQAYLNLQKTVAELPETYQKATTGMDVNANQLSRIVGTKSAALAPALETAKAGYETGLNERDRLIAATQAEQQKQLQPYEKEQQFMSDRWARESSGFSTDNQMELDAYKAKLSSGVQLTEGEQGRANELEKARLDYEAKKYSADKNFEGQRLVALASLGKSF